MPANFQQWLRTGKSQFSIQSQRKAMPKNVQTTAQSHSSHMLVKSCSKFSKPGFSNTWTMNFQMFKLVLEKSEEQGSNCQHRMDNQIIQRVPEKHLFLRYWLYRSFDYVDNNKVWKVLKEMGIPDHQSCFLRNLYAGEEATLRTGHRTTDWFQVGKGVC